MHGKKERKKEKVLPLPAVSDNSAAAERRAGKKAYLLVRPIQPHCNKLREGGGGGEGGAREGRRESSKSIGGCNASNVSGSAADDPTELNRFDV